MVFHIFVCFSGTGPCLLWLVGHSYVYWGSMHANVWPAGHQLGFPWAVVQVSWIGVWGLLWSGLLPEVQFYAGLDRAPDILFIHTKQWTAAPTNMAACGPSGAQTPIVKQDPQKWYMLPCWEFKAFLHLPHNIFSKRHTA